MSIPFFVLDSFTDSPFEGNPAGVFFDDRGILTSEEMRRCAGEVHLESAFILPPGDSGADFKIRYFTGVVEVPLCGHDTVAAMTVLARAGRVARNREVTFATTVGAISARIDDEGTVSLFQNLHELGPIYEGAWTRRIAAALGCGPRDIEETGLPIQRISTGTPWLIVPVTSKAVVDAAPADFAAIVALSRETETFGIYLFIVDSDPVDADSAALAVWSRCFAPIAGLDEDPVTGSASGALGAYLLETGILSVSAGQEARVIARQGFAGGRGGTATITAGRTQAGAIEQVTVSGKAIIVAEGAFTVR